MERRRLVHGTVVAVALLPAAGLVFALWTDRLGANPIEELTHETGDWGLRFLLASLAVTPLRQGFGWSALAPYRRSFGLLAFGYASLHLLVYLGLDQGLAWDAIWEDVLERRYITMGFAAFCCLVPLALTSTRAAIRRLGRRWVKLHRLAYVAGICAAIHFIWLVKADLLEPLIYAGILAALLGARIWRRWT